MIQIDGKHLAAMEVDLQTLSGAFELFGDNEPTREEAREVLNRLIDTWNDLGWTELAGQAKRLLSRANHQEYGKHMAELTIDLQDAFMAKVGEDAFLVVPSNRRVYYETTTFLLTNDDSQKLGAALDDIGEAGKCFALDRWTACVFHLMRAVEATLHLWAPIVGVTLTRPLELEDMGTIINNVGAELERKIKYWEQQSKSHQKVEELEFFSALNLDFRCFKNEWRNKGAHARFSFNESQAKDAMTHVGAFLHLVSSRLQTAPIGVP
jgi:hypothetical protein